MDVLIVGAGAAGLATAIFAARARPGLRVVLLDGAKKPGAKILVSGGGRCNVTNAAVSHADYHGGSPHLIQRVLRVFTVQQTIAFFREIGVELYEDYAGKLFPKSDSARTVLDALLNEAECRGVRLLADHRVTRVERIGDDGTAARFRAVTSRGDLEARRLVVATGGMSLPKSGSDGAGFEFARSLGHAIVAPTPALVPLVLGGEFHRPLSGVAHDVEAIVRVAGGKTLRHRGALLWTHFGVSGPVILDVSRHWHRAALEGRDVALGVNLLPGQTFETVEALILSAAQRKPRQQLATLLAALIPARVGEALLARLGIAATLPLAHLPREDRRRLLHALLELPLPVKAGRGYGHAEVTAGGVPLAEIDVRTMASRVCPGLHLVGEILDCDGRIGGFNFQWAWSTGFVAGRALAGE